jgi:hypothetical protein
MLEDIEELRTAIGQDHDMGLDDNGGDETSLIFGATKSMSFQQVLSRFLPPRDEVDRLVAAYFRAKAVAAPFIHATHFSRLYRLFWDSPSTASPLWTSILFSILDIATRILSTNFATSKGENIKDTRFATAAANCMMIGEYSRVLQTPKIRSAIAPLIPSIKMPHRPRYYSEYRYQFRHINSSGNGHGLPQRC